MARFYDIKELPDISVIVNPTGHRGRKLLGKFPIFKGIPYFTYNSPHFSVEIEYGADAPDDYRSLEFNYIYLGQQPKLLKAVKRKDNQESLYKHTFRPAIEHDGQQLIFNLIFPEKGKIHRIVESTPIGANFFWLIILPVVLAALLGWFLRGL